MNRPLLLLAFILSLAILGFLALRGLGPMKDGPVAPSPEDETMWHNGGQSSSAESGSESRKKGKPDASPSARPRAGNITIAGRVTDQGSGTAIEGATVLLLGRWEERVVTGLDGSYRFKWLAPGRVVLLAFAKEHLPLQRATVIPEGVTTHEHDISLTRGVHVSGIVVDAEGGPLSGVSVWYDGMPPGETRQTTGLDGAFVLPVFPLSGLGHVTAELEGYAPARAVPVLLDGGAEYAEVRITLQRGGGIRGRVLFENGSPAAGALVTCALLSGSSRGLPAATTDDDGGFALFPLPAGDFRLDVAHVDALVPRTKVTGVRVGSFIEDIEIRLAWTRPVTGRVVDTRGNPVVGIEVQAHPVNWDGDLPSGDSVTDTTGAFEIEGLAPEKYRICVKVGLEKGEVVFAKVEGGARGVTLIVPPQGAISGRLVVDDGALPTSAVFRLITIDREGRQRILKRVVSVNQGRFRIGVVPVGTWSVTTTMKDWFTDTVTAVVVESGVTGRDIVLTLLPPATVYVRVVDREGRPAAGAWVRLRSDFFLGSSRSGEVGSNGDYTATGLRPGAYKVSVTLKGAVLDWLPLTTTAGATTGITLELPGTGGLAVRVTDEQGEPVSGAAIDVRMESGMSIPEVSPLRRTPAELDALQRGRRTDAGGVSRRDLITEGRLSVRIVKEGYREANVPVTVRHGEVFELEVALKR